MTAENLHMGLIMDGNRRYAKRLALQPWKGHDHGAQIVEGILDWCKNNNIKEISLYTISIQNLQRPKIEIDYLMEIFRKEFQHFKDEKSKVKENKLRIRFLGRKELFPEDIQKLIAEIEEDTKDYTGYKLNFCFGYGGQEEIIDAFKEISKEIKKGTISSENINTELVDKHLYNASKPDFIIRTSGEHRTSNFLLWQSTYSEWIFVDKLFPEMKDEDFDKALLEFNNRKRRFGK